MTSGPIRLPSLLPHPIGLSHLKSFLSQPYFYDSAKLLAIGSLVEGARRLLSWLIERFRLRYSISAQFDQGDPAYEWLVLFLTQENIWKKSRHFQVTAKNSQRKWGVTLGPQIKGNAEFVPAYGEPHLFRWNGCWVEVRGDTHDNGRQHGPPSVTAFFDHGPQRNGNTSRSLFLTIYTLDMSVLSQLVEEARRRYLQVSASKIVIHATDARMMHGPGMWSTVKHKHHRPLDSLILEEGVIDSIVKDAREFFKMESWYVEAGIPYHRGYLLYGPPGSGKTSTIYALAGELGLEIYSLSLASSIDDYFLQRAALSIPKRSILLIEDIDCAFPSREDTDEDDAELLRVGTLPPHMQHALPRRGAVTMSGLLNVLDGVGSEEGGLFFATTNYVNRLDAALLRPGRIDMKVEYRLATRHQARALFNRFYPASRPYNLVDSHAVTHGASGAQQESPLKAPSLSQLADTFADAVPVDQFSVAELQGYLLTWKMQPAMAVAGIEEWVERELLQKRVAKEQEEERKKKVREAKEKVRRAAQPPVVVNITDRQEAGLRKQSPEERRVLNGTFNSKPKGTE